MGKKKNKKNNNKAATAAAPAEQPVKEEVAAEVQAQEVPATVEQINIEIGQDGATEEKKGEAVVVAEATVTAEAAAAVALFAKADVDSDSELKKEIPKDTELRAAACVEMSTPPVRRRKPGDKPTTPELNTKPDEEDSDTTAGADAELHAKPDEEDNEMTAGADAEMHARSTKTRHQKVKDAGCVALGRTHLEGRTTKTATFPPSIRTLAKQWFDIRDLDNNGTIDLAEWKNVSERINRVEGMAFDEEDFKAAFEKYDANKDGSVTFDELLTSMEANFVYRGKSEADLIIVFNRMIKDAEAGLAAPRADPTQKVDSGCCTGCATCVMQ